MTNRKNAEGQQEREVQLLMKMGYGSSVGDLPKESLLLTRKVSLSIIPNIGEYLILSEAIPDDQDRHASYRVVAVTHNVPHGTIVLHVTGMSIRNIFETKDEMDGCVSVLTDGDWFIEKKDK